MNRDLLQKELAQTGYNVGYAAKKHLATFDIVEKAPGWITLLTLAIGIFALVVPTLEHHLVGAAVLVVGVASLYFNTYLDIRGKYEEAGKQLTTIFTDLRALYYEVQSRAATAALDDLEVKYRVLLSESQKINISRQIFMSDWYAHYKFFWQAQIDWLDEQLHFRLLRDKIPLTATLCLFGLLGVGLYLYFR